MSRPLPRAETRLSGIAPLSAPRSLTQELMSRLAADITSGKLAPGSQLPTEQELIAATGVSRTVVREAVAQLRAEGLVVTRQGVGAFVVENPRRPFRLDVSDLQSLHEVIEVM
jgi:DNA-binding FadR family transcriptional regulator